MKTEQTLPLLTQSIPAVAGINDPTQARMVLYQGGRAVHAPLDQVGLLPLAGGTLTGALRLTDMGDAGLASTTHALQIGSTNTVNIIFDGNEIMARNNGATSTLYLNFDGGGISLGSSTAPDVVRLLGGQLVFPATPNASSDANTLDGYEEGTFTPSISFAGVSTGITYSSQAGFYTKIGNRVLFSCYVGLTNKGAAAGQLWVNLPFPATTTASTYTAVVCSYYTAMALPVAAFPSGYVQPATATILTTTASTVGSHTAWTNAHMTNSSAFMFAGHYMV